MWLLIKQNRKSLNIYVITCEYHITSPNKTAQVINEGASLCITLKTFNVNIHSTTDIAGAHSKCVQALILGELWFHTYIFFLLLWLQTRKSDVVVILCLNHLYAYFQWRFLSLFPMLCLFRLCLLKYNLSIETFNKNFVTFHFIVFNF